MDKYVTGIKPINEEAMLAAQSKLDGLVKPPGSLGELETIAIKLSGISGQMHYDTTKRCVIVMASDNGVVEEGVSLAPQSVTYVQTMNFTKGITGVNVLAKQFNADLIVVDVGVNGDTGRPGCMGEQPAKQTTRPMIRNKKIRNATWNIAKQAAMTREEAVEAITVGIDTAIEAANDGYKLIGVGEMGIGNTTTSAAVLCALSDTLPEQATGKGAGLNDEAHRHKIKIIQTALERNKPDQTDPVDVLAKVGGFDIAAMAGVFIGAAYMRMPVVIDGFISIVAALAAARLNPLVKEYMFASHASFEQGYKYAAQILGIKPCLRLNMRLGEGSGCPLMFAIMDAACAIMRDMGTFEQGNISEKYVEDVKDAGFHIGGL